VSIYESEIREWRSIMGHTRIRLGPLALLLAVISICMTTLGVLAITTANADLRIAGKYADMVQVRYDLETEGQTFLREAGEAVRSGLTLDALPDTETDEDGVTWKVIWREDFKLTAGVSLDDEGGLRVVCWRIGRTWEPETSMGDLWDGE